MSTIYPSLYQINTRVWITEMSAKLGRPARLDDIPDAELDQLADQGFDWIWLLSVWQTGNAGRQVSRSNREWRKEFEETLPDLKEEDIGGSGFAITGYTVHQSLGGDEALARLRKRLARRGLKLMLDFVPNHMALDHPWLDSHPDYFVRGTPENLVQSPKNYVRLKQKKAESVFALGRDPYFSGWPDTLQLNYGNPLAQEAMIQELTKISAQCDGVRCDMAMLLLPDIFERTWGIKCQPFWSDAIGRIKKDHYDFILMGEVYWDLEWALQQQGFDYTYDKRLYDRLHEGHPGALLGHLHADIEFQNKLARFMENHDEPRAAKTFPNEKHKAAAVVTYFIPGLRFFHQGQFEGKRKRISPHLVRGPQEPVDEDLRQFYNKLLDALKQQVLRTGTWTLLECAPWENNGTNTNYIGYAWDAPGATRILVVVNYSPNRSQTLMKLSFAGLSGSNWRLEDIFTGATYERDGNDLGTHGLFLDEPGWGFYAFTLSPTGQ